MGDGHGGRAVTDTPKKLLSAWIARQATPDAAAWLRDRLAEVAADPGDRALDLTLGRIPRVLGRADLVLGPGDLSAADAARTGWSPAGWSLDGAARVLALLSLPAEGSGGRGFAGRFRRLRQTSDAGELVALLRGLPLYPEAQALEPEAAEGLRTSMRSVFEAVAHHNPYPAEVFDRHRWNHMVLKALFIGSPLAPIQGLEARANAELALVLRDYARERRAAGRPVSPELWRCVGPFAVEAGALDDLARTLIEGDQAERNAARAALAACPDPEAALLAGKAGRT